MNRVLLTAALTILCMAASKPTSKVLLHEDFSSDSLARYEHPPVHDIFGPVPEPATWQIRDGRLEADATTAPWSYQLRGDPAWTDYTRSATLVIGRAQPADRTYRPAVYTFDTQQVVLYVDGEQKARPSRVTRTGRDDPKRRTVEEGLSMRTTLRIAAETESHRTEEDWGSLTWLASREVGNAEGIVFGRVIIHPGRSNPRHSHANCEEVLYLLAGSLRHTLGQDEVTMEAGDTLVVEPGLVHNATNIGQEDADMIVAYSAGTREFRLES